MDFYTIVIIIAAIFLILCLVGVGLLMQRYNAATTFPPVQNPCPDGWMVNGQKCLINENVNTGFIKSNIPSFLNNTYGLSNSKDEVVTNPLDGYTFVNFNDKAWNKSGSSICGQKKWANQYGISWDGVSNNTGC